MSIASFPGALLGVVGGACFDVYETLVGKGRWKGGRAARESEIQGTVYCKMEEIEVAGISKRVMLMGRYGILQFVGYFVRDGAIVTNAEWVDR